MNDCEDAATAARRTEQENRELRRQLAVLQRSFEESQSEIAALRKALARSEATMEKTVSRKERVKIVQRPRK
jgi:hypothetical protein